MKKAFTLVELIIVLSVIAIIAIFSIGQYSNVTTEANLARVKAELKTVRDATIQYVAKTEKAPVNTTNNGVYVDKMDLQDNQYAMINLEFLGSEITLDDGKIIPPCITAIPFSAKYTKPTVENSKRQEPSFIYVMDNKLNVYLAEAKLDELSGYFIQSKIYETPNADIYEKKYKMEYEGDKLIVVDVKEKGNSGSGGDSGEKDDILIPEEIKPPKDDDDDDEGGGSNVEKDPSGTMYVRYISRIGYTVFVETDQISSEKVKEVSLVTTANSKTITTKMYAVESTKWMCRISVSDLNNYSGYYKSTLKLIGKDDVEHEIHSMDTLIDRNNPAIEIKPSKVGFFNENPITVTLETYDGDNSSGIDTIEYKLNSEDWKTYETPIKLDAVKYYEIQARCKDKFGNLSTTETKVINDYTKPEIYINPQEHSLLLDLGVYIDEDDTIWETSFEESEGAALPSFRWKYSPLGPDGGQMYSTDEFCNGERSYKLITTYYGKGNYYNPPQTSSNQSIFKYPSLKNVFHKDTYMATSYRYKSTDTSYIRPGADGARADTVYRWGAKATEKALKGSRIIKVDDASKIIERNVIELNIHSDGDNDLDVHVIESVDKVNNTITLARNLSRDVEVGEELYNRPYRGVVYFPSVTFDSTKGDWRIASIIAKTESYPDYDPFVRGGRFYVATASKGNLFIDDLKMGFAPRIILYKNGERFNTEEQEYTTSYADTDVPDKTAPKMDDVVIERIGTTAKYNIKFVAKDEGTQYVYHMESIARSGKITESEPRIYTSTSGISEYRYLIDTNPTTTDMAKFTTTKEPIIHTEATQGSKKYIHVQVVDMSGNISAVTHKEIN